MPRIKYNIDPLFSGVEKSENGISKKIDKKKYLGNKIKVDGQAPAPKSDSKVFEKQDFQYLKAIGYDPFKNAEDYYYDAEAGQRVIDFFCNELKFTKDKWKGEPFIPYPEQEERLRCIFGWKRKSDGLRRYRNVFLYIPRKNGKSEESAGIANYCLFCDAVNDAEIYIGARDRGQASTLYNMSAGMIMQNPNLRKEVVPYVTSKSLEATWDNSKIQAISGDALSQHSLSPSVGVIDELHAHVNGDLLTAIRTGMGGRQKPLLIMITTADLDRPSMCNDELSYARAVRDGQIKDLTFLPIIYETPVDADWKDEEVWKRANPNYPITPNKDFMVDMCNKAQFSTRILSEFKRYNLNMVTASVEGWLNMDYWRLGNEDFDEDELAGEECYCTFDLASKIDLSALVLFFPESKRLIMRAYCPQNAVDNDKTGYYREWVEDNELIISGEMTTDYRFVRADIEVFDKKYNIRGIAFDPHNANNLINELVEIFARRIEDDEDFLVEFTQTYRNYTDPAKEFEKLILDEDLKHNSRVLDWMACNVTVREGPSGDIMPQKPKRDSPLKIDGIVAGIMAVALWLKDRDDNEDKKFRVINLEDYA